PKWEVHAHIVKRSFQRKPAGLSGYEFGHNRSVPGQKHIQRDVWLPLHVDHLAPMRRLLPARGRLVLATCVEVFNKDVFHIRTEVGKCPGNALVMAHDDKGKAGQRDSSGIEPLRRKMGLVPYVRDLMMQMHVTGKHR